MAAVKLATGRREARRRARWHPWRELSLLLCEVLHLVPVTAGMHVA